MKDGNINSERKQKRKTKAPYPLSLFAIPVTISRIRSHIRNRDNKICPPS